MVTRIFLIRHGQTEWSLSGQHTGRTDIALTEHGEQSAVQLGTALKGFDFAHVLTSPLQRARRTCELAGFGDRAHVETDLREWDYGDYEGRTTVEILQNRPGWNIFEDGCPHGESVDQISLRADRLLDHIRRMDGVIALFSHGHFLRALGMRWIGLPMREGRHFALDTASLSILGYEHSDAAPPVISLWNANHGNATSS